MVRDAPTKPSWVHRVMALEPAKLPLLLYVPVCCCRWRAAVPSGADGEVADRGELALGVHGELGDMGDVAVRADRHAGVAMLTVPVSTRVMAVPASRTLDAVST
jgi:hypothetical protein